MHDPSAQDLLQHDAPLGPVSTALDLELRELARAHGVIVWLDKEALFSDYAKGLARRAASGTFPFPVIPFEGSFLELLFALEGLEDGVEIQPLVLHMPGYTEEEVAKTPAYELYRAGRRHRRALATLVRDAAQGKVPPAAIDAMVSRGLDDLAAADAWLDGQLSGDAKAAWALQPSPDSRLPSSQASPTCGTPLPQTSAKQLASQPSPSTVPPSSHCST